jgi:hypothetical protein
MLAPEWVEILVRSIQNFLKWACWQPMSRVACILLDQLQSVW